MRKPAPAKSPTAKVISLAAERTERARKARELRDERSLLWVSRGEADFLSHMYQHGLEAAAKRLMELAGKPWPAPGAKPRKVKAKVIDAQRAVAAQ